MKQQQKGRPRTNGAVPPSAAARRDSEARRLFDALLPTGGERVPYGALFAALDRAGVRRGDPRLAASAARLDALEPGRDLGYEEFAEVVQPNLLLIDRLLSGRAIIPEFADFAGEMRRIFDDIRPERGGLVADYIPQLSRVDGDQFGMALCTIDGQRLSFGDAAVDFTLQSANKPVTYCLALEEHGADVVHRHVGCEPSGASFNELALNREGLPHNPMINAGAILSGSLIRPGASRADRFEHVVDTWRRLSGQVKPNFSNSTYLSERQTADRNFALGYSMRESGAFPAGTDVVEAVEFYMQCCSIEVKAETLSVVAATLAIGGVCPTTGERVLQAETVQNCLSLMGSCGMYDFSGSWAFAVGLPAKSSVSGVIWVVVPNVMGLCVWSPRLDSFGNSVRGVALCRELVRTFNFHGFDGLAGGRQDKQDPRRGRVATKSDDVLTFCWAASEGDLVALRHLVARGVPPGGADYDGRTPLHLAASEGRLEAVEYLLGLGTPPSPRDRWGGTPLDDAVRGGHAEVEALLQRCGAAGGADAA